MYEQLLEGVHKAQRQKRHNLSKTEQQIITLLLFRIKEAIVHERFPKHGNVRKEVELVEVDFKYDTVFVWIHHKACAKEIKAIKHMPGEKLNVEAIATVMQEIGLKRVDKGPRYQNPELRFAYRPEEGTQ